MEINLNEIEIEEGNLSDLSRVYRQLQRDFPPEELKEYSQMERLIAKGKYKILLAKHKGLDALVGYACIYEIHEINGLWLDYIAVDLPFRNSGYGSALFNVIAGYKKEEGFLGVFLEVEIPGEQDGPEQEIQKRRIRFYERNGAKRLAVGYRLPTKEGFMPMHLYFKQAEKSNNTLTGIKLKQAITSALAYIHTDIPHTNGIISKITRAIQCKGE
ncbi:GNAT family N-acetyltransferase [Bacillus sp. FJAT-27445]|uniref:GNAT family N-acetyltransferase n=1 Tax=Bacillus sp. FJAT-27445 TaxID=1679166 RepID=UPI000A41B84A|nr:GNAT family N-acetyltransferase [Bacillus sp. FJAT-27445]